MYESELEAQLIAAGELAIADSSLASFGSAGAELDQATFGDRFLPGILDRLKVVIETAKNTFALEASLRVSKLAYYAILSRIPYAIPPEVSAWGWTLLEQAIRQIYAG